MLDEQLIESWRIHNRIHLYLLESISSKTFNKIPVSKGRDVGNQFAHLLINYIDK